MHGGDGEKGRVRRQDARASRKAIVVPQVQPLRVRPKSRKVLEYDFCRIRLKDGLVNGDITRRLRTPLQYLSMGIFIAFVALALAANWALFLEYAESVAALVIAHNALALGAGFAVATLAGLSAFDRRAIMIETGIQNSGLGLILIFGFFSGLGGMAVVAAFWGIWHAVSGLALAGVLARGGAIRPSYS